MDTQDTTKPRSNRERDMPGEGPQTSAYMQAIKGEKAPASKPAKKDKSSNGTSSSSGTGALFGAAAAGVAIGLAANLARKLAVQAPTALAGDWDKALAAEHAVALKVFDALEKTTSQDAGKRATLLAQLKHALSKHALQEENVIYPALRDSGNTEAADHLNHDHGYVKQYLYELTNCPKDSNEFLTILAKFRVDIEEHIHEEEDVLYPAMKASLSPEMNKKLTTAMNKEGFKLA